MRTNTDGNKVCDSRFYPYGEEHTPPCAGDPYKFTGKERDAETGLDYFGARHYGSYLGRFVSVDPVQGEPSNPQTWNRYSYTSNNPINRVDPDGQQWFVLFGENGRVKDYVWVEPNEDGSYTSPGEGYQEIESLTFIAFDHIIHLGETSSGRPIHETKPLGLKDNTADFVGFFQLGRAARDIGVGLWRQAFPGARAGEIAFRHSEVTRLVAKASSTVGWQSAVASSREAALAAAEQFVGKGARPIFNRATGQAVGKSSADGTRVCRVTSIGKDRPYANLQNKLKGGNFHVRF